MVLVDVVVAISVMKETPKSRSTTSSDSERDRAIGRIAAEALAASLAPWRQRQHRADELAAASHDALMMYCRCSNHSQDGGGRLRLGWSPSRGGGPTR